MTENAVVTDLIKKIAKHVKNDARQLVNSAVSDLFDVVGGVGGGSTLSLKDAQRLCETVLRKSTVPSLAAQSRFVAFRLLSLCEWFLVQCATNDVLRLAAEQVRLREFERGVFVLFCASAKFCS